MTRAIHFWFLGSAFKEVDKWNFIVPTTAVISNGLLKSWVKTVIDINQVVASVHIPICGFAISTFLIMPNKVECHIQSGIAPSLIHRPCRQICNQRATRCLEVSVLHVTQNNFFIIWNGPHVLIVFIGIARIVQPIMPRIKRGIDSGFGCVGCLFPTFLVIIAITNKLFVTRECHVRRIGIEQRTCCIKQHPCLQSQGSNARNAPKLSVIGIIIG